MARVLFLTSRFPFPLDKGDKLRAFNQIKELSKRHEVHVFSLSEEEPTSEAMDLLRSCCASITNIRLPRWKRLLRLPMALLSGLPFQVRYFQDVGAQRALKAVAERVRPEVMHVHLVRMGPYVSRALAPRITLDFMDCFSIGAEREASWSGALKRILLRVEGRRLARYERRMMAQVDAACIISPADRASMPLTGTDALRLVPNGVDFGIFHPLHRPERYDVLFTGHMAYPPNIAAAMFTVRDVLPELRRSRPEVDLLIAGKDAPRSIHDLREERVAVIEQFDHIREAFAMSKVMIAPMRISIGLQNKILQAMAMGIPVVTTTQGNAAIGGEHERHLLVADDARGLAACVERLLSDEPFADRIAANAKTFVAERFTWERACAELDGMFDVGQAP